MKLAEAKRIAENLLDQMKPWTERIMIAGSVRRGKPEVKDIELVVIPKYSVKIPKQFLVSSFTKKPVKQTTSDFSLMLPLNWELFGNADNEKSDVPTENGKEQNLLYLWGNRQNTIRWIKTGVPQIQTWEIKPDGRYWRGLIEQEDSQIKLDLFLGNPKNWGVQTTIRTGPENFSTALMAFIKNKTLYRVQDGHLTIEKTGEFVDCPEEEDFFKNIGIQFVPVKDRANENPYTLLRKING